MSFIRTLFLDNPLAPFLRRRFCFCFQPPAQKLHLEKDVERACSDDPWVYLAHAAWTWFYFIESRSLAK